MDLKMLLLLHLKTESLSKELNDTKILNFTK